MQHSKCLPLRWETTVGQWWYASPIEWAAANGHYDLVRELLLLDGNNLIELTSLRRLCRLETLWEDTNDPERTREIAACRAVVAKELLKECESRKSPLVRAGYGGWLIYTAALAGDLSFVQELIERDPMIVFGEGEYGVTDILYAAAKSNECNVFQMVFDSVASPSFSTKEDGDLEELRGDIRPQYKWEMMNRAFHAAARGGNLKVLKELVEQNSPIPAYRDANGSTVLHTAAAKGHPEVVEYLLGGFDLIDRTDHQGNTPLHVAAYRGQLQTLKALVAVSPALISARNYAGETFLHMAVSGFQSPDFQRLDRQIMLVKHLISDKSSVVDELVNLRTNNGRTALHLALIGKSNSALVGMLMNVPSIDLNVRDEYGMSPLDVLKQQPPSAQSDVLIRKIASAGGECRHSGDGRDSSAARSLSSQLKMMQSYGFNSPGTLFGFPDGEILLQAGPSSAGPSETGMSSSSLDWASGSCSSMVRSSSSPARRLKRALCPSTRERKPENVREVHIGTSM